MSARRPGGRRSATNRMCESPADELVGITSGVNEVVVPFELAEDRVHLCGLLGNEKHGDCRHDSMTSASPRKRLRRNRCRLDRYQDSECSSPHARPPSCRKYNRNFTHVSEQDHTICRISANHERAGLYSDVRAPAFAQTRKSPPRSACYASRAVVGRVSCIYVLIWVAAATPVDGVSEATSEPIRYCALHATIASGRVRLATEGGAKIAR
jgi:hypothetical protein